MRYWILKGNRRNREFDNDFERTIRAGARQRWFSRKLLDSIEPNDRLFIYEGSPRFEILGLARYVGREGIDSFIVEHLTDALTHRVQRDRQQLRSQPAFRDAPFLKAGPVQTLYPLTAVQASWLHGAMVDLEPSVGAVWRDFEKTAKRVRALSIRQPWAELIMAGKKKIEFRSRPTHVRGRVHVYASEGRYSKELEAKLATDYGLDLEDLPRGVLVGTVEITDCSKGSDQFEWKLSSPVRASRLRRPRRHPQPSFFYPF